jgi:hypothetical protein
MLEPLISWETPEHVDYARGKDWYWAVGIIAVTVAVLAFIFGNPIFGIFIVVAAATLAIKVSRDADTIRCAINDRGVIINDVLFPFLGLESFWVDLLHHTPKLIIKSRKPMMPFIIIPLTNVEPEDIRQVLLNYIAEVEHPEPVFHKVLDWLGF